MNKGGTQKVGEMEVTMVNAVHSCGIQDGDMKLIADLYAPKLALLPVGDHFTMGPQEATLAIRMLGVRHVVPLHFGTFPLLPGSPDLHAPKPGESLGDKETKTTAGNR